MVYTSSGHFLWCVRGVSFRNVKEDGLPISYHYWRIKFLSSTVMLMFCKKRYPTLFCFAICYFNLLWVLLFNLSIVIYLSLVNTPKSIHLYNSSPDFNYFLCQCISMYFFRSVSMFTKTRLSIVPLLVCSKRWHTLYIITLYSHRWQCGNSMTSFPISQTVVKSGVC